MTDDVRHMYPRIGTAVHIVKDGKVLLGKREKGSQVGSWCVPGGAVDMYETPTEGAIREVFEETGLIIEKPRLMVVLNDVDHEKGTHWVTLQFVANWLDGEPRDAVGEIGNWAWFDWDDLPEPLFAPTRNFVKNGYNPHNFN
jgi:8-oxo-dGTP diphosphatase